jgi:hypothetical protein
MFHCKLSVLDLEYVKTMSFQYLVNRPATQIHSYALVDKLVFSNNIMALL